MMRSTVQNQLIRKYKEKNKYMRKRLDLRYFKAFSINTYKDYKIIFIYIT